MLLRASVQLSSKVVDTSATYRADLSNNIVRWLGNASSYVSVNLTSESPSFSRVRNCSLLCFVVWDLDRRGCGGKITARYPLVVPSRSRAKAA
jgi:hypothetical protein